MMMNNTDPERLQALEQLPPPTSVNSLRRTLGLFAYYPKWIPSFSDKVCPLINVKSFPVGEEALKAF